MKNKRTIIALMCVLMIFAVSAAVSAEELILFEDGFEEGLDQWTLVAEPVLTDDYVNNGEWAVLFDGEEGPDDQLISVNIDATGMQDLVLSYARLIQELEGFNNSDDYFMVEYSVDGGENWEVLDLEQDEDGVIDSDGYEPKSFSLSEAANNNPNVQISFKINANNEHPADFVALDDVLVTGEEGDFINPVGDTGGEYSCDEDSIITLFGSSEEDPEGELLTYDWDLDNDGDYEVLDDAQPEFECVDGYYEQTINMKVTDEVGNEDLVSTTVFINNVAPWDVDAGEYTCDEGATITLSASATDVEDDPLTYNWDLDGDSVYEVTNEQSVSYECGNGYAEVMNVGVQVTDDEEASGYDNASIVIENVAPIGNANGPYETAVNQEVCFTATVTDPVDTEFEYEWDFDYDGDFSASSPEQTQTTCTSNYDQAGNYTVALRVSDDWDYSEVVTTTVTVYEYGIELEAGQNLISIPLVPENTEVEAVLNGVNLESVEAVWAYKYNPETQQNEWYFYPGADAPEGVGNLDEMVPGYGYYVYMEESDTLFNNGEKFYQQGTSEFPPQVDLTTGWNLVGHYGLNPVYKEDEVYDLSGSFFQAHLAPLTLLNEDGAPVLSYMLLMPGEGYWLFVTGEQIHADNTVQYVPSEADYDDNYGEEY